MVPGTNRFLIPATRNGIVSMSVNQNVELFCSGSFVAPFPNTRLLTARCAGNNRFIVNERNFAFSELACTAQLTRTARINPSQQTCRNNATQMELGYSVAANRFLSIMDVCHDQFLERTLYSHYIQTPANSGFQRGAPRPSFITGPFFGRNVDRLYTGAVQRVTIGGILGASRVTALWDDSRSFFLARGHLAANADFIFATHQRATFFFVNASPQWQSFNAGNWERIEAGVRAFVANRNMNTEIYTGTFQTATKADVNGIQRELFLDFAADGRGLIPVPRYFYKVVIGELHRRGVVFIGVNDPHLTQADVNSGRFNICRDVSSQINYINWNIGNLAMGYSYACDVNEFVNVVGHLPLSVRTTGLLV